MNNHTNVIPKKLKAMIIIISSTTSMTRYIMMFVLYYGAAFSKYKKGVNKKNLNSMKRVKITN